MTLLDGIKRNTHFLNESFSASTGIVDTTFRKVVLSHIIGNYSTHIQAPLFLAIHGLPGEGKTFQTLQICYEHQIKVCYFSGSELSGNYERDSILEFSEDYKRACNYRSEGEYCVIIIDDFHLSPASTKEGVGTTVNSQLLTGYLMNLCDKAKSSPDDRVPIILLGNTFENVYSPLKRDGRMNFYHWSAPLNLKKQIVGMLFGNYLSFADRIHLEKLVEDYQDMPVSFFSEIKNDIDREEMLSLIDSLGHRNIETYIKSYDQMTKKSLKVKLSQVYQYAEKRKSVALSVNTEEGECDDPNQTIS